VLAVPRRVGTPNFAEILTPSGAPLPPALEPEVFEGIAQRLPESMVVTNADGITVWVNDAFCALTGRSREEVLAQPVEDLMPAEEVLRLIGFTSYVGGRDIVRDMNLCFSCASGARAPLVASIARVVGTEGDERYVLIGRGEGAREEAFAETTRWAAAEQDRANEVERARDELAKTFRELQQTQEALVEASERAGAANEELQRKVAELERMETELRLAQKLEAVGKLAAGVAHEINTPVQFIGDNIHFLREAYDEVRVELGRLADSATEETKAGGENVDLPYLDAQVPSAFQQVAEGVNRIAKIVRAMKAFAHDGRGKKTNYDVNHGLETTFQIAQSEFKHVADVEFDLGEVPLVYCEGDQINQVFLNLIVNAAHAIQDVVGNTGRRGKLSAKTRKDADSVVVSIGDTGTGIADEVRNKMFDLFFSTKEVGRGTGQGLSLVWSVVVEKHGGNVWVDTEVGVGTTFHVRLPVGAGALAEP
jgi:PAS domain S-box-containing protein